MLSIVYTLTHFFLKNISVLVLLQNLIKIKLKVLNIFLVTFLLYTYNRDDKRQKKQTNKKRKSIIDI